MSREFGDHTGGYFHDKVRGCVDDLKEEATEEFHKEFIPLFESLYEIAYAIASVEACDSSLPRTINTTIEELPRLKRAIAQIEQKVEPYKRVAEYAVEDYIRQKEKK